MDNPSPSTDKLSIEVDDLREEAQSLRKSLNLLLVTLLIGTAGVGLFILQSLRTISRESTLLRQTVEEMQREAVQMHNAVAQLQAFGLRSPDYATILAKYQLKPEALPAAANPAK